MKNNQTLKFLQTILLLAGAAGSLILMFNAGRNQSSVILITLFTIWVLSPFAALLAVNAFSKYWANPALLSFFFLIVFITIGTLVSYSGAFNPPGTKPAFKFLITPLVSWLLIIIIISIIRKVSRKKNQG